MPNIKSAEKRMRTAAKRHDGNVAVKSRISTVRRKFMETIDAGDKAAAGAAFKTFCSALDKAVKRGALKANAANRRKSRAAAKVAALA